MYCMLCVCVCVCVGGHLGLLRLYRTSGEKAEHEVAQHHAHVQTCIDGAIS